MKQTSLVQFYSSIKKPGTQMRPDQYINTAPESQHSSTEKIEEVPLTRLKKEAEDSMNLEKYFFVNKSQHKPQQQMEVENKEKKSIVEKPEKVATEKKKKKGGKAPKKEEEIEEENQNCAPNSEMNDGDGAQEFLDSTPSWALPGQSRDKNGKLHGTSDADPSTLMIPEKEFKKLTKSMQQYWQIKSENFDKIIFFKLGKFYELFYEDALVGNKYLDLNWMGRKMHTGFPEKTVDKYSKALLEYGFKVAVIDQVETPEQMAKRVEANKKSGVGNTDKLVHRELSQVLTKGTYLYEMEEELSPDERILMVIRKRILSAQHERYGIVMLERQTNVISMALVENEDRNFEKLKTLLLHMRPVEVVIDPHNIPSYDPICKMLKGQTLRSIISALSQKQDNWDSRKGLFRLEQVYFQKLPEAVEHFKDCDEVMQALSGMFSYLHSIQIMERILECAKFKVYDEQFSLRQCMIIDSQALCHLEILESPGSTDKKDLSLFGVINKTSTPSGHRLLKRWICAPLCQINQIQTRQQSVVDLSTIRKERDLFRQSIKSYPDFERLSNRIYEYSIKSNSKAVFYEDLSQIRLKEFRMLIQNLRQLHQEILTFSQFVNTFRSPHLQKLVTPEEQGGLLPDVISRLDEFMQYITWDGNVPQPVEGVFQAFDDAQQEIRRVEEQLNEYLAKIKKRFNNDRDINYAHSKFRYEIEIPNHHVEKEKPAEFEFTSSRQGYKRFHTRAIKDMVQELEEKEDQKKKQLTLFVQFVFKNFKGYQQVWDQLVAIMSELDALASLSAFGDNFEGVTALPTFVTEGVELVIQEGKHPCLTSINYVPSSIDMGSNYERFLLLTGPNMGGKSTLMRMVCVLTILAQMGCRVPCKMMRLSPVDRIFTRIGARDYLMEGKSTFYVELEEILLPLRHATEHSILISDELGRGTSTYDGVAIASAVMKYLVNRIRCRVLFATHFRILVEETKLMDGVTNVHMGCFVQEKKVVFLYTLRPGACPASFGINVAKAVGIANSIIVKAEEMAEFFDSKVSRNVQQILSKYNEVIGQLC